jgi:hypothetical protein
MTYTDYIQSLYADLASGATIRDYYDQPLIRPRDVILQMTARNTTSMQAAIENCMTETANAIRMVKELHREAFYQLAAHHESELRRLFEGRYL